MTIIEFIGSPGSGKTSICCKVMDYFEAKGFKTGNVHRDEIRKGALSRKILSAKTQYMPSTHALKCAIATYVSKVPAYEGSVWERDLLNVAYKLRQPYVKSMDYAFFDEGPTQYVSAMMNGIVITDTILPLVDEMNRCIYQNDVIAFFIQADIDNIVDRICKRRRNGDPYFSANIEGMKSQIAFKEKNLLYLADHFQYKELHYIKNDHLEDAALQVQALIEAEKRN